MYCSGVQWLSWLNMHAACLCLAVHRAAVRHQQQAGLQVAVHDTQLTLQLPICPAMLYVLCYHAHMMSAGLCVMAN
jgi:hypothetical protein